MPRYLVSKLFDPNEAPEYRATLAPLAVEEETVLAAEPGRFVVERQLTDVEAAEVSRRPHIKNVEPNHTAALPTPEVVAEAAQQLDPAEIRDLCGFAAAHAAGGTGRHRVVAVLDTGASQATMQELSGRVLGIRSEVQTEPNAVNPEDSHGDWCLQILAYLLPEAHFLVVKVLSYADGSGSFSGVIRGLGWAQSEGCTSANMSLGGPRSEILNDAVNAAVAAGLNVAVAAGNEQRGRPDSDLVADRTSPASAERVTTIGAAGSDLLLADFSNRGACLDLSAPGRFVRAPNVEGYWDGSSMAAPVALAALEATASAPPGRTGAEARQLVLSRARDTGEPATQEGNGFLDLAAVFAEVATPEEYHPDLPRIYKSNVDDIPTDELHDFVMKVRPAGARARDAGVFRLKRT